MLKQDRQDTQGLIGSPHCPFDSTVGVVEGTRRARYEIPLSIRDEGESTMIGEHKMRVISGICEYVYVLDAGAVTATGEPTDVQKHPRVIEAYPGAERGRGGRARW